jgi:hypothetical protein
MTTHALEKVLAVILVTALVVFLVLFLPTNPQLIDWILPISAGILTVAWLIAFEGRQRHPR